MLEIPILRGHDCQAKPIGRLYEDGGALRFAFHPGVIITGDDLFRMFSGAGIVIEEFSTDTEGRPFFIRKGRILEFSFVPPSPVTRAITEDMKDTNQRLRENIAALERELDRARDKHE